MIERPGEVAVVGLGVSGVASSLLLRRLGRAVYASDAGTGAALEERAARVRAAGGAATVGGHDLERLASAAAVVVSPGVPPDVAPLARARAAGVPVISEVELGLSALPGIGTIAVTGTNGKTTVTALVAHLLRALGADVEAAGNIGTPVCEIALREHPPRWLALEMSSFQLHDTPSLHPTVGVLTNLAPDHLDRYPSVDAYYADKALLFQHAGPGSRWVVNQDDGAVMAMVRDVAGYVATFSADGRLGEAFLDPEHDMLIVADGPLMPRAAVPLLGAHNVANVLAAALAVMMADGQFSTDAARERLADAVTTFRPPAHRLEPVHEGGGVVWVNDSKATNVASCRVALESMTRPTVLLLGGRHKGEPYTELAPLIDAHCRVVLAYGEAGPLVVGDLGGGAVPVELVTGGFADVMHAARDRAQPGDVVLLSPACASYDMFTNYQERGATFARLARELAP